MQPTEFWQLSPCEWWWELDARIQTSRKIEEMAAGKGKSGGKFTSAEWEDARRRHRERKQAK